MGFLGDIGDFLFGSDDKKSSSSSGPSLLDQHAAQQNASSGGDDYEAMYESIMSGFSESLEYLSQRQTEMMAQSMGMMAQIMAMSMFETPEFSPIPAVEEADDIDFSELTDRLANEASGNYFLDEARKKGLGDTVHTSSLLDDDDDLDVTASPLGRG